MAARLMTTAVHKVVTYGGCLQKTLLSLVSVVVLALTEVNAAFLILSVCVPISSYLLHELFQGTVI